MTDIEIQIWTATYAAMVVERYAQGTGPDVERAIRAADFAVEALREAAMGEYFDSLIADDYEAERALFVAELEAQARGKAP